MCFWWKLTTEASLPRAVLIKHLNESCNFGDGVIGGGGEGEG